MSSKEVHLVSNNSIHYLDCSGINGSPPPYKPFEDDVQKFTSYGATNSPGRPQATSIIFCVHGNKYGVARCCDDLHAVSNESETNSGRGLGESYQLETSHATDSSGSK